MGQHMDGKAKSLLIFAMQRLFCYLNFSTVTANHTQNCEGICESYHE